jgi:hypothetical protein
MSHGSQAEIVPFVSFLERRRRLFPAVPPPEGVRPPTSTDPGNSAIREREPRTMKTTAVASRRPKGTTIW